MKKRAQLKFVLCCVSKRTGLPIRAAMVFLVLALLLTVPDTSAQQTGAPRRVVVLYWYDKDFPGHVRWEQSFKAALRRAPEGNIEYYPEFLEANRFPELTQSQAQHDYLKQKYADRPIDVVVAQSEVALNFLIKYRADLFTRVPIVFYAGSKPTAETLSGRPNITGVVVINSYRKTLQCALALLPNTDQVFVVSGSIEHDKRFENMARQELKDYEGRLRINYLTDLPPVELVARTARLPERSIVLYAWQQALDEQGKLFESIDVLTSIANTTTVPIFAMSSPLVGHGILGGYVYTPEAGSGRVAEMVRQIINGQPVQDIPIENVPTIPMFDWRELHRWKISEDSLPIGSVVQFKEISFWQQYKFRIISILALVLLQTAFIAILLIERSRRRRANALLDQLNAELETRIKRRTAALATKSRELETFAYSVAHDLKAPLRGIDGYSRLLQEDYAKVLDQEGQNFLHTIRNSSKEMSQLIDDLLAYSRLERRELMANLIELGPIIRSLVDEKKREAERPIDFVVNVNGGTVVADVNGLSQSLKNYLDNAIKFTRTIDEPRIEVGSQETAEKCLLWVRDNGIGFDMKYHDRIFDIFQRLGTTEDYPGTGIGLAIVRKAMARMGGRAWAESKPGDGATFYLEIPK
jgi:signal transduction histidine kinase/ABC-type uncharacterized transport system substrate-binding protein